jgi:penicillin amidase
MINPIDYLPDYNSDVTVSEITENVSIFRDQWGIPHIEAENFKDLFFAQGFTSAQDRLFQMDLDRLRCMGRSSEYLGKKAIANDKLNLKRNFEIVSKADLKNASTKALQMITSYTKGVNFYISNLKKLPFEYQLINKTPEMWENWHSILVYKIRNAAEGSFNGKLFYSQLASIVGGEKAAKLTPGYFPGALLTLPPDSKFSGEIENAVEELTEAAKNFQSIGAIDGESNGWSVSGDRTYSGKPLVGGDSHRTLDTPNVYYQVHLKCSEFEGMGHTIPGYPGFMHFAHNKDVAWGMTHGGADTQDLFLEKLRNFQSKVQYFSNGNWHDAKTSLRTINPRNMPKIEIKIIETKNGNIIFGSPEKGIGLSLSDPGGENKGTFWIDSAFEAMISKSADELEKAFDKWTDRTNNYPYVDVNNNFGYKFAGSVPIRDKQHEWGIAKGWEDKYSVNDEIPRDELPKSRNPKNGWVVTCNQKVVDFDYPYFMSVAFAPEYRAKVLINYLKNHKSNLKIQNMLEMHNQNLSIPAEKLITFAKSTDFSKYKLSTSEELLLYKLHNWDFLMDKQSVEASIYSVTKENIIKDIVSINYGNLSTEINGWDNIGGVSHVRRFLSPLINEHIGDSSSFLLNKKTTWEDLYIKSFKTAIKFLQNKFGDNSNNWKWGNLHKTNHQHPLSSEYKDYEYILNPKKIAASGDGDTPLAGSYDKNYQIVSASVNRYAHDPSNWENSRWIVPLGSSGNPGSKNYSDQLEIWANGETIPQLWNWDEIKKICNKQKLLSSFT